MKELELKYGCNPNQKPARIFMQDGGDLPIDGAERQAGLHQLPGRPERLAAGEGAERGHRPAGRRLLQARLPRRRGRGPAPERDADKAIYFVEPDAELSPIACAYARARGADRMCSYGDWVALSRRLRRRHRPATSSAEVSDGIIAPGYTAGGPGNSAKPRRKGELQRRRDRPRPTRPPSRSTRTSSASPSSRAATICKIDESLLDNIVTENKDLPEGAKRDLIVALITLKYTQSNSVCYVKDGQAIGVGAGQQSRIHCTRLAGNKADNWYLRQHPKVLALPFVDGIRRPDRDNAIDVYISDEYEDVLARRRLAGSSSPVSPEPLTARGEAGLARYP